MREELHVFSKGLEGGPPSGCVPVRSVGRGWWWMASRRLQTSGDSQVAQSIICVMPALNLDCVKGGGQIKHHCRGLSWNFTGQRKLELMVRYL